MTGKIRGALFLTNSEREELLKLTDTLHNLDFDTMEQLQQAHTWARILERIVLGKRIADQDHYPVIFIREKE